MTGSYHFPNAKDHLLNVVECILQDLFKHEGFPHFCNLHNRWYVHCTAGSHSRSPTSPLPIPPIQILITTQIFIHYHTIIIPSHHLLLELNCGKASHHYPLMYDRVLHHIIISIAVHDCSGILSIFKLSIPPLHNSEEVAYESHPPLIECWIVCGYAHNYEIKIPGTTVQNADHVKLLSCSLAISSVDFVHVLCTSVQVSSSNRLLPNQTYPLAEDKNELPQALTSTFSSKCCSFHIQKEFCTCSEIGTHLW